MELTRDVIVDGKEYKLQRVPVRKGLEIRHETRDNQLKMYDQFLEHIVVKPRMSIDDFNDLGNMHLDKLMSEVADFQYQGK